MGYDGGAALEETKEADESDNSKLVDESKEKARKRTERRMRRRGAAAR